MSFSAILRRSSLLLMRPAVSSLSPIHHYSSSAKTTSSDNTLLGHIEDEIRCASAAEAAYKHKCKEVPDNFPFTIKEYPGNQNILLRRTYRSETIEVTVSMPYEHSVEGDESVDEFSRSIDVHISKKNWPYHLEFGCTAMPYQILIHTITKENYRGPDFLDLGENLQKALHKYLEIRGITTRIMNFMHKYMISKYRREQLMRLKNLKSFVEA